MLLVTAAISRNEGSHNISDDPAGKTASQQEAGEPAALHIRGMRGQRTHAFLSGGTAERLVVDLLFLRDVPNGGVNDRAGDAFSHERLTNPAGAFPSTESRGSLGARHIFVVEQSELLEANDCLLYEPRVLFHLAQPLFQLTPRATRPREHAKGAIEAPRESVRGFKAQHGGLVERYALLERGGRRNGIRVDEPLPAVDQSHAISAGLAHVLGHPFHDSGGPGRKKSRGATHNEPW